MKILIAEDNHFYRIALKSILEEWGFEVVEAPNGAVAWEILKAPQAPKIAILDWMMPEVDGINLCRRVRTLRRPEPTYIIILTSLDGKEHVVDALNAGADDFVQKPFDRDQLRARLQVGKRIVGLQTSQTVVYTFARAVEAKSPYTQGHADRVTHYALALADQVSGISDKDKDVLRRGALLHDIGKISIPEAILNKTGTLDPAEFEIIKLHPALGADIVKPLESLHDTLPLIHWHHERLDGSGYPLGLSGDQIPLLVRILSIVDVYDALASKRPYRPPLAHEQCLEILRQESEQGKFDRELLSLFQTLPRNTFSSLANPTLLANYRYNQPTFALQDSA